MKISSVCRSGCSCSCRQRDYTGSPCTWVCYSGFAHAWVHEHMRAAAAWTNVHQADASMCIPAFVPVLVRVARAMCTAGWPGKTCLSVCGTSLASLSPRDPRRCPEAGRLGWGTSSQGRPQAVSVHYSYRDGMRPAGGWTFTPYLL